jgi:rhamnosyl/mannosyltransferase
MKVLFVCHRYHPSIGGYETQLKLLAENLSKFFHVKILTFKLCGGENFEKQENLEIYRVSPKVILFRVPFSPSFMNLLNRMDFDLMHSHGFVPFISDVGPLYAKTIGKKKIVYTHHFDGNVQDSRGLNILANLYTGSIGRLAAEMSDVMVATSATYAQTSPLLKNFLNKVKIIPCMVDTTFFAPQSEEVIEKIRKKRGLDNKKVILFVGRIVPYKGLEYLVRALSSMEAVDKNFHLVVIGKVEGTKISGGSSYFQKLCDEIKNLGLTPKVSFVGNVTSEELRAYYSLANVLVLPSIMRGEAFGSVLLEALACGTPVIASSIPGVKDVLRDNNTIGCYVPPKDYIALGSAIVKMAYRKEKIAEKCRSFAVDNYSSELICEKYVELYRSLGSV